MLRDNKGRARMARLVLVLLMLASGSLVLLGMAGLSMPNWESTDTDAGLTPTVIVQGLFGLMLVCYFVLLAASYVFIIMWLRRAYYNLHQLPGIHPEFSEGWAAGAWFVPFLNFVRPYTIMREVWLDTQRAAWGRVAEPSTILGWWWAAFVAKMIISRITNKMGSAGNDITQDDLYAFMVDGTAQLVAAALTWQVIGRGAKFEEQLALRQQVDQLGQIVSPVAPQLQAEQSNYALEEGY